MASEQTIHTSTSSNAHDLTAKQSTNEGYLSVLEKSQDSRDKSLVIREVVPGIITFSVPFARAGAIPIGGRSTAIRHSSGNILIYVSHPHTPATAEVLAGLGGEVKWLVVPDGEHGMSFTQYTAAYPQALAIGGPMNEEKMPEVKWAGILGKGGETQTYGFEDEITLHRVSAHQNDEILLHHAPSGTLVEADMLFNLPPTEQYSRSGGIPSLMKMLGGGTSMSPGGWTHDKMVSVIAKDKALAKRELAPIQALRFDRIIPCHGDVIETGGRAAWDKVWAKYA